MRPRSRVDSYPGLFWGSGQSIADLLLYWNLTATGRRLLFVDPAWIDRYGAVLREFDDKVSQLRSPVDGVRTHVWIRGKVSSSEAYREQLEEIRTRLGIDRVLLHHVDREYPAAMAENFHLPSARSDSVVCFVERSETREFATVPLSGYGHFHDPVVGDQKLVASVCLLDRPLTARSSSFATPFVRPLNEYYGRNAHFEYDKARVEPFGLGFIVGADETFVRQSAIDMSDLIAELMRCAGLTARLGHAGKVARNVLTQVGGLWGASVLKSRGVREILSRRRDAVFSRQELLKVIGNGEFGRFQEAVFKLPGRRDVTTENVLRVLVECHALRVGMQLRCERCELRSWYDVDDLKSDTICPSCRTAFAAASQIVETDWCYRLSGVFASAGGQLGATVAVVVLNAFSRDHYDQVVYAPGMEFVASAARASLELDVCLILQNSGGVPDVVLGECKSKGRVEPDRVTATREVYRALEGQSVRPFILWAKDDSFSQDEVKEAKRLHEEGVRIILIAREDLETRDVYEIPELPREILASRASGWAEATWWLYFREGAPRAGQPRSEAEA